MLRVEIPGRAPLELEHLVVDLNGTLATDGQVPGEVRDRLGRLAGRLRVLVLTADTLGEAARSVAGLPVELRLVGREGKLGALGDVELARAAVVGNGVNDAGLLRRAALGIAVLGPEGLSRLALLAAEVVVGSVVDALDLLLKPHRLRATLRA